MQYNPFESLELKLSALQFQVDKLNALLNKSFKATIQDVSQDAEGINLAIQVTGLAKGTIYNLVCERKIPHFKRGKRIYFNRQELQNWIREGRRMTKDEVELTYHTKLS